MTLSATLLDDHWLSESGSEIESLETYCFPAGDSNGVHHLLRRQFTLDITDYCVNYVLHLRSAPLGTEIIVNGQTVAQISVLPFVIDITMYVMLEDNALILQVPAHADGHFAGVALQPIPCD
jgi:hypothetical protein